MLRCVCMLVCAFSLIAPAAIAQPAPSQGPPPAQGPPPTGVRALTRQSWKEILDCRVIQFIVRRI